MTSHRETRRLRDTFSDAGTLRFTSAQLGGLAEQLDTARFDPDARRLIQSALATGAL